MHKIIAHVIIHFCRMLLEYLLLTSIHTTNSSNVYFWPQNIVADYRLFSFCGARVLILATVVLQAVRKMIHHLFAKCFSSKGTSWWKYEVAYNLIPTKEDFPFPWHEKILVTLDLIYASILCVFVNNDIHLLNNIVILLWCVHGVMFVIGSLSPWTLCKLGLDSILSLCYTITHFCLLTLGFMTMICDSIKLYVAFRSVLIILPILISYL